MCLIKYIDFSLPIKSYPTKFPSEKLTSGSRWLLQNIPMAAISQNNLTDTSLNLNCQLSFLSVTSLRVLILLIGHTHGLLRLRNSVQCTFLWLLQISSQCIILQYYAWLTQHRFQPTCKASAVHQGFWPIVLHVGILDGALVHAMYVQASAWYQVKFVVQCSHIHPCHWPGMQLYLLPFQSNTFYVNCRCI